MGKGTAAFLNGLTLMTLLPSNGYSTGICSYCAMKASKAVAVLSQEWIWRLLSNTALILPQGKVALTFTEKSSLAKPVYPADYSWVLCSQNMTSIFFFRTWRRALMVMHGSALLNTPGKRVIPTRCQRACWGSGKHLAAVHQIPNTELLQPCFLPCKVRITLPTTQGGLRLANTRDTALQVTEQTEWYS